MLPPLCWKELWVRRREEATITAEPRTETGGGRPGWGAGRALGVPNTAATGRCPAGLRGRGPARTSAIPYTPGWAASAGWERARNFCWDKRSLCLFFFFSSLSGIQLPIPASCGWRTWWNF